MRKIFWISFIIFLGINHLFSQSKKEQIELLKLNVDSLKIVLENERNFDFIKV